MTLDGVSNLLAQCFVVICLREDRLPECASDIPAFRLICNCETDFDHLSYGLLKLGRGKRSSYLVFAVVVCFGGFGSLFSSR